SYSIENSDTGTQIRAIAKAQGEAENKANQAIDDSKRSAVGQLFLGPKYQQLREAKQVMEQNRVRVQELQKIMAQISNQADKTQLQTQINTLEIQNIALENQLESETNKFSFLGWLFSLIYQY
ncbi:MAG: hypothetical protein PHW50_02140, partial [Patescibacteria group bacterium]|nr:hypothetical protein [Patescibacteria group bacterium]